MRGLGGVRFEEWLVAALLVVYAVLSFAGLVELRLLSYFVEKGLQVLAVVAVLAVVRAVVRGRKEGLRGSALARKSVTDLAGFVRDWIPWVVLISVYENTLLLTAYRTDHLYDLQMFRLDEVLFGGHGDLWLQRVTTYARTVWVAFFYDALYVYMVGLGGLLYLLGRRQAFRRYLVSFLTAGYVGYALYFLFPVVGPYYYFDELYTVSMEGLRDATREVALREAGAADPMRVFYDVAQRVSAKESYSGAIPRNCFPSLHTAWGLLILLHAFRSSRWLFAILVGPVALMLFGTIYLRFHYAIDLVAGGMLAWLVETISPALVRVGAPASCRLGAPP